MTLSKNFIFLALSAHDMERLIDVFCPVSCAEGEDIIEQGAQGDFMYFVEKGHFEVLKRGEGKVSDCPAGTTFGELALLYGAKRSATVKCTIKANLWAIDRTTFRLLLGCSYLLYRI